MKPRCFPVVAWLIAAVVAGPSLALDVAGKKPAHVWGGPSSVANEQAITRAIWAPGIDEGYVPQGLTIADGQVLVSGYRSTDTKVDKGPCRVFRLDPATGALNGQFDLPEDCGHAGGLAYAGKGVLIAADTRRLYRIDLAKALADGNTGAALTGVLKLAGDLKGSFIDLSGTTLLVGVYDRLAEKSRGYRFPLALFDSHAGKTLKPEQAEAVIPLPVETQGAAFDKEGFLWTTSSSSRHGRISKLDAGTGQVLQQFEAVIGIEDLGFDEQGGLWSVSEAGSLRWQKWGKTFPVVFRLDVGKLK